MGASPLTTDPVALNDARQPRSDLPDRWYTIAAVVLSIGACGLALFLAYSHKVGSYAVETDFYGGYARQASRLLAGGGYGVNPNPPGYVLLLGGVAGLLGDPFVAGKVLSAVAAGALGYLTYALVRPIFDARTAVATTMLVLAALIPYSFVAATDLVGAALIVLPVVLLLRHDVITPAACLGAGAAAGIAYLVRANALFLVIGFAVVLLLLGRPAPLGTRVRNVGVMIGAFVLVTAPWMLYNWSVNGSPLASVIHLQVAARFFHPDGDNSGTSLRQVSDSFASMGDVLRHDPMRLASIYVRDALLGSPIRLAREPLRFPAFVFAAIGLVLLLVRRTPRRLALLTIFVLGYLLMGLVGFIPRYYLFLYPMLFLLVAYVLFDRHTDVRLRGARLSRVPINAIAFGIVLVVVLRGSLLASREIIRSEPRHLLEVADVLRQRASAEDILIARKPHLAYLAGVRHRFPLVDTPDEFLGWARARGARFLLYTDSEAAVWRGLRPFADPGGLSPAFRLLYRHEDDRTLLYEIVQ